MKMDDIPGGIFLSSGENVCELDHQSDDSAKISQTHQTVNKRRGFFSSFLYKPVQKEIASLTT